MRVLSLPAKAEMNTGLKIPTTQGIDVRSNRSEASLRCSKCLESKSVFNVIFTGADLFKQKMFMDYCGPW